MGFLTAPLGASAAFGAAGFTVKSMKKATKGWGASGGKKKKGRKKRSKGFSF